MPSMIDIPSDPKKVRARLRSYEGKLRREKRDFGSYNDGAGKRYFLIGLYLVLDDLDGAMESIRWFEREFSDDSGMAVQLLCWALALYRNGREEAAKEKLRQCMLANRYVLPRLLGRTFDGLSVNEDEDGYLLMHLDSVPEAFFALWTDTEKAWAAALYDSRLWSGQRERAIDIEREIEDMPRHSEERKMLRGELAAMRYGREERRR